jgi:hypothetical protein
MLWKERSGRPGIRDGTVTIALGPRGRTAPRSPAAAKRDGQLELRAGDDAGIALTKDGTSVICDPERSGGSISMAHA